MKINLETLNIGLVLIGITFLSILVSLYIICVLLILSVGPIYLATALDSNWFYILYLMDIPLIILIVWGLWKLINIAEEFMD